MSTAFDVGSRHNSSDISDSDSDPFTESRNGSEDSDSDSDPLTESRNVSEDSSLYRNITYVALFSGLTTTVLILLFCIGAFVKFWKKREYAGFN